MKRRLRLRRIGSQSGLRPGEHVLELEGHRRLRHGVDHVEQRQHGDEIKRLYQLVDEENDKRCLIRRRRRMFFPQLRARHGGYSLPFKTMTSDRRSWKARLQRMPTPWPGGKHHPSASARLDSVRSIHPSRNPAGIAQAGRRPRWQKRRPALETHSPARHREHRTCSRVRT